ncbi:hypothetical protein CBR_g49067 [Chara braunii]|uniref:Uncharacterized protein n=1 Tax=Chara braunii TaxID=69332 RepID=A0A388M448_CHABU|nr:hypothetical protein CBR_g49067 [Chara braunii]|eukprot:GBG89357.1 hypothetical protein CBR_g49067 [Chara braunii]
MESPEAAVSSLEIASPPVSWSSASVQAAFKSRDSFLEESGPCAVDLSKAVFDAWKSSGKAEVTSLLGTLLTKEQSLGLRPVEGPVSLVFRTGCQFTGRLNQGRIQGLGRYRWTDGVVYLGAFKDSAISGVGSYLWPDLTVYQGEVENGKRQGQGALAVRLNSESSVIRYIGDWQDGLREGRGICESHVVGEPYPRRYEGEWVQDRRSGFGTFLFGNQQSEYQGMWALDKPHGQGMMSWCSTAAATVTTPPSSKQLAASESDVQQQTLTLNALPENAAASRRPSSSGLLQEEKSVLKKSPSTDLGGNQEVSNVGSRRSSSMASTNINEEKMVEKNVRRLSGDLVKEEKTVSRRPSSELVKEETNVGRPSTDRPPKEEDMNVRRPSEVVEEEKTGRRQSLGTASELKDGSIAKRPPPESAKDEKNVRRASLPTKEEVHVAVRRASADWVQDEQAADARGALDSRKQEKNGRRLSLQAEAGVKENRNSRRSSSLSVKEESGSRRPSSQSTEELSNIPETTIAPSVATQAIAEAIPTVDTEEADRGHYLRVYKKVVEEKIKHWRWKREEGEVQQLGADRNLVESYMGQWENGLPSGEGHYAWFVRSSDPVAGDEPRTTGAVVPGPAPGPSVGPDGSQKSAGFGLDFGAGGPPRPPLGPSKYDVVLQGEKSLSVVKPPPSSTTDLRTKNEAKNTGPRRSSSSMASTNEEKNVRRLSGDLVKEEKTVSRRPSSELVKEETNVGRPPFESLPQEENSVLKPPPSSMDLGGANEVKNVGSRRSSSIASTNEEKNVRRLSGEVVKEEKTVSRRPSSEFVKEETSVGRPSADRLPKEEDDALPVPGVSRSDSNLFNLKLNNCYVGEFKSGLRDGQGCFFYASGATYIGTWKANQKEGRGYLTTSDGDSRSCRFTDDRNTLPSSPTASQNSEATTLAQMGALEGARPRRKPSLRYDILYIGMEDLIKLEDDPEDCQRSIKRLLLVTNAQLYKIFRFYASIHPVVPREGGTLGGKDGERGGGGGGRGGGGGEGGGVPPGGGEGSKEVARGGVEGGGGRDVEAPRVRGGGGGNSELPRREEGEGGARQAVEERRIIDGGGIPGVPGGGGGGGGGTTTGAAAARGGGARTGGSGPPGPGAGGGGLGPAATGGGGGAGGGAGGGGGGGQGGGGGGASGDHPVLQSEGEGGGRGVEQQTEGQLLQQIFSLRAKVMFAWQFWELATDCNIWSESFPLSQINRIVFTGRSNPQEPNNTLLYWEFVERLVHLACYKYPDIPSRLNRVEQLMKSNILGNWPAKLDNRLAETIAPSSGLAPPPPPPSPSPPPPPNLPSHVTRPSLLLVKETSSSLTTTSTAASASSIAGS